MDTRAEIGVTTEKGTIYSVYCNLNGDVKNVGRILLENYNDYELVRKLVSYGDIYELKKYIDNGIFNRNESREETTIYDIRDRNLSWSLCRATNSRTLKGYLNRSRERDASYAYLFDKENNEWLCYDLVNNESYRLEDKLRELGYVTDEKEGHKAR